MNREIVKEIHRKYIRLIANTTGILEKLFFEPKLQKELQKLMNGQRELLIIDVGANRGQSIRLFNKLFLSPLIYAFEPSEEVFSKLERNCRGLQNVRLYRLGLGATIGTATFYQSALDETSSFVYPNTKSSYFRFKKLALLSKKRNIFREVHAQMVTLDSFIGSSNIPKVDLLKIDVEGLELEVLKGATNCLEAGIVTFIQFERHEDKMRRSQTFEIYSLLQSLGFKRIISIKHSFGNFYEDIWALNTN